MLRSNGQSPALFKVEQSSGCLSSPQWCRVELCRKSRSREYEPANTVRHQLKETPLSGGVVSFSGLDSLMRFEYSGFAHP